MNDFKKIISNEDELELLAEEILEFSKDLKKFMFCGELGSGKTTLIKKICRKLGVKQNLSSPSFSIINEYITKEGVKIYHMDLYRIKSEGELFNIGLEDYLFSKDYCFIEWPEVAYKFLPDVYVNLEIKVNSENFREIKVNIVNHK